MSRRPTPEEPVEVGKMWKSPRDRRKTIVFAFKEYEGHLFFDCRIHDTNAQGQSVPTSKGIGVGMALFPEFAATIAKAVQKAIELGLIDADRAGA